MVTHGDTAFVGTFRAATGAQVWRMNGYQDRTLMAHPGFGNSDDRNAGNLAEIER